MFERECFFLYNFIDLDPNVIVGSILILRYLCLWYCLIFTNSFYGDFVSDRVICFLTAKDSRHRNKIQWSNLIIAFRARFTAILLLIIQLHDILLHEKTYIVLWFSDFVPIRVLSIHRSSGFDPFSDIQFLYRSVRHYVRRVSGSVSIYIHNYFQT